MPIRFACPSCRTAYTVNDRDAGKKAECKACGQRLQVPAPPRNQTVLGELLPPDHGPAGPPADAAPTARHPMPDLEPAPPRPGPGAHQTGPIRFDCPACRTGYTVNQASAGRSMACRACGRPMVVPGAPATPAPPRPSPARLPVAQYVEEDYGPELEEPEYIPPPAPSSYLTPRPFTRAPNGPANRTVGGVGAALVLLALFLPMVTGPFGFWLSFIDVPWKAATGGFAVLDEVREEERTRPDPAPLGDRRAPDRAETARPQGAEFVVLVAIGAVLYPFLVLTAAGLAGCQVAAGQTCRGYFAAGLVIGAATAMYAVGLLLLNAVPETRLVMKLVSPGFGWAVMLVGSLALLAAEAIRLERLD